VLDFTSALYLGLRHASESLRPWDQLTTGVPAALAAPPEVEAVADRLARLIGCERAALGTSTLHLFWDLFGLLDPDRVAIYADAGLYPIGQWGIERAVGHGAPFHTFPHHDVEALQRLLQRDRERRRPLIVSDGFCPGCGRLAPLADYLHSAGLYGGQLIVDDTQALGIFGYSIGPAAPYGNGGGGSLRAAQLSDPSMLVISSLAKAFGVPLAMIAGSRATIRRFEAQSQTRVHCSPPSLAALHAAEHALNINDRSGDELRRRLAQRVRHFRMRLASVGLRATGGLFPVQTLRLKPERATIEVHNRLRDYGIETVLQRDRNGRPRRLSFIMTARHRHSEIERAVTALVMSSTSAAQARGAINGHTVGFIRNRAVQ
jgi:8-amino-7-oxononanoate synthase